MFCSIYAAIRGALSFTLAHHFRASSVEPDQAFGQALRSLRNRRKWSQTELALRADVDRNYISLIELGKNSPSVRVVFRLCDALDVTPSDVLKDVEKRMRSQALL